MVKRPEQLRQLQLSGSDSRRYKGGGGGSSTSVTQNYSPEEAAQRAKVQREAAGIYNQTSGSVRNSPYPGAQVVPFSGDTLTGQNLMRTAANTMVGQYLPSLANATQFGLGGVLDINSNPYLQQSINAAVRPITESFTDAGGVMSSIRNNAVANGGQGQSTRQGVAEGIAAGRYADAVGDTTARLADQAYGRGLDTFSRVLGLTPQTMQTLSLPGQLYSGVGAQQEQLAQAQEGYNADTRNWQLNAPWVPLQNWANIVYGNGATSATSTTSGGGMQRNPLTGALGGALAGAQLGSMVPGIGTGIGAAGGAILGALF
jgi:hypothetical protein